VTFAVADAALWRALPYFEPDRLAILKTTSAAGDSPVSLQDFVAVRDGIRDGAVAAAGAFTPEYALTGFGEPRQVRVRVLSADYFRTLGVGLATGREFTQEEEKLGAGYAAILTHHLRERLFGDRSPLGMPLAMNGRTYTVVGVLPPFQDFLGEVDVYVPYQFPHTLPRKIRLFSPVVRLGVSGSIETLQQEIVSLTRAAQRDVGEEGVVVTATSLPGALAERSASSIRPLLGAGLGLMLIAVLDFTMLMAARARQRMTEFSIRLSLGASWRSIIRLVALEALALSAAGLATALWLCHLLLPLLTSQLGEGLVNDVEIGFRVVTFACSMSVLAVLGAGAAVTWPLPRLLRGARGAVASRLTAGRSLVVLQLGISLALVVSSVLLARSFLAQRTVDPGFVIAQRSTSRIALPAAKYSTPEKRLLFWRHLLDRLETAGIDSAITTELPLTGQDNPTPFVAGTADGRVLNVKIRSVSPRYLELMGVPIREGRALGETERQGTALAVVVNEQLAKRLAPAGPPLGQILTFDFGGGPQAARVVGVSADVRHEALHRTAVPEAYFSFEQTPLNTYSVLVASALAAPDVARHVRAVLDTIDSGQPFSTVVPFETHVDQSLAGPRIQFELFAMFSVGAVVIAASGVYSLLIFLVSASRSEWALRLAVGATPQQVFRMVIRQAVGYAGVGIGVGVLLLFSVAKSVSALLYGVAVWDPLVAVPCAGALAAICVGAAAIPARRAAAISPMECLRP
jgi:predicted permease